MREVVSGLWQIPLAPREAVNAYLLGDVLVDAGTPGMGKKLPDRLAGRPVAVHAITHAHGDHVGGSKAVCDALGTELWAPPATPTTSRAGTRPSPRARGRLRCCGAPRAGRRIRSPAGSSRGTRSAASR